MYKLRWSGRCNGSSVRRFCFVMLSISIIQFCFKQLYFVLEIILRLFSSYFESCHSLFWKMRFLGCIFERRPHFLLGTCEVALLKWVLVFLFFRDASFLPPYVPFVPFLTYIRTIRTIRTTYFTIGTIGGTNGTTYFTIRTIFTIDHHFYHQHHHSITTKPTRWRFLLTIKRTNEEGIPSLTFRPLTRYFSVAHSRDGIHYNNNCRGRRSEGIFVASTFRNVIK